MDIESARGTLVRKAALATAVAVSLTLVAGCRGSTTGILTFSGVSQTTQHGYVIPEMALEQIPPGSSKDQVLIALGTPSTTGTFGGEVFYYISQTRHQSFAFTRPKLVEQRVVAVYFDQKGAVERVANYGLKDGRVFDFITRTTPTGGLDQNFLQQVLSGAVGFGKVPGT
jgi:outer membrane protein assembly factor BamE (lipoprotein component of BamABCDE complex)